MRNPDEIKSKISEYVTREFDVELHMFTLQIMGITNNEWIEAARYVDATPEGQMDMESEYGPRMSPKLWEERYESYYRTQSYVISKLLMQTANSMSSWNNLEIRRNGGIEQVSL